ncbi:MAG: hypothetical protein WAS54_10845 [Scrofimicrobium sp.]
MFIRSAIAGMTVLLPDLVTSHPDLVRNVREDVSASLPDELRFYMAIAPDRTQVRVEGVQKAQVVAAEVDAVTGDNTLTVAPFQSAMIHFPPFSLVLADPRWSTKLPHADCSYFMEFRVDEVRDLDVAFPVVKLSGIQGGPAPFSTKFETTVA